ncbi:MAG: cytochrome c [Bacteroidetes bacterium]|nr:cytochrome c [Bacteroidota bacterium]
MKRIITLAAFVALALGGCSQQKAEEGAAGQPAEEATKAKPSYYKIQHVDVAPTVDPVMAKAGADIFDVKCTACHKLDERYVGPALGQVTQRRPPEYIMNMILDTETMINNDDTVQCLLQTYLLKMPNQSVDEKDARNVLEFLRKAGDERK